MGTTRFGFPDQWEAFSERNRAFFERFPNLQIAFDKSIIRILPDADVADRMIFLMGRLCLEDFMEMLLLAGNGYGVGALKIVRGLYERAVAIAYLSINPEKAVDFLDFAHVERFKAIAAYTEAYPSEKTSQKMLAEARVVWESVKSRFPRNTWSGLDFVAMAKTCVGLDKMLAHAYYLPLSYAHGTARAVVARLVITEKGGFEFSADPQPKEADQALHTAHKIMLLMLGFQLDYFGPEGLTEILQTCTSDFISIWQKPVPNASDNDLTEL